MHSPDYGKNSLTQAQWNDVLRMEAVLNEEHAFFLLNEQRTGKLITFIGFCHRIQNRVAYEHDRILIVAPLGTLNNVAQEFYKWLGWHVAINPTTLEDACNVCPPPVGDLPECEHPLVVAVNTETIRNPAWWGFRQPWDVVFLDEAHRFGNRHANQTQGAFRLVMPRFKNKTWVGGAKKLIISTGTPTANGKPRELWPLLHMADRKKWSSFWRFMYEYSKCTPAYVPNPHVPQISEDSGWRKDKLAELQEWIAGRGVRREYADVTDDTPIIPEVKWIGLEQEHWAAYHQLDEEWRTEVDGVEVITPTMLTRAMRLAQFAVHPPLAGAPGTFGTFIPAVVDHLVEQLGKVVVFCWHKEVVSEVARWLQDVGADEVVVTITGDTSPANRTILVDRWRDPAYPNSYLVATISALSEGIDLSAADYLNMVEESWVPKDNDQAMARIKNAHRQRDSEPEVFVYLSPNTILEDKHYAVQSKRKQSDVLLSVIREIQNRGKH